MKHFIERLTSFFLLVSVALNCFLLYWNLPNESQKEIDSHEPIFDFLKSNNIQAAKIMSVRWKGKSFVEIENAVNEINSDFIVNEKKRVFF